MCVTDRHDVTVAVKLSLNPDTTNQSTRMGLLIALPKDTPTGKISRESGAARNHDSWFTSQAFYHWVTQNP